MRLDIRYRTTFTYDDVVRESQNELRACPASDDYQQLMSYRVTTNPSARVYSFTDYWGTRVDAFGVREPHVSLEVVAEAAVETRPRPLLTVAPPLDALEDLAFLDEHVEYLQRTEHVAWDSGVVDAAREAVAVVSPDVVSHVLALHRLVGASLRYVPGSTYVGVPIEQVLARREGVCQDFAHLAVALCRAVGIPARYVSGYLFTVDDSTGADTDADVVHVQTHAWFEAAVPRFGWLALDPTNQQAVDTRHVSIGRGRDYDDVVPLRGVFGGAANPQLDVEVEIRRMPATGRPARERRVPARAAAGRMGAAPDDELGHQQQQSQQ